MKRLTLDFGGCSFYDFHDGAMDFEKPVKPETLDAEVSPSRASKLPTRNTLINVHKAQEARMGTSNLHKPLLYKTREVCVLLNCGTTKLHTLMASGALDARKSLGSTMVTADSVQRYIDNLPRANLRELTPRNTPGK